MFLFGFLLDCRPLCHLPLLFMMTDFVLEYCETKVQLQHIPQSWFGHMKLSFTMLKTVAVLVLLWNMWRQNWRSQLHATVVYLPACRLASRQRSTYCGLSPAAAAASSYGLRGNPVVASSSALTQSHQLHGDSAVLHCELVLALGNQFSISLSTLLEN